ncbi:hypothetical protein P9112_001945 [Eukaryota sp. TZLM1-RC]
MAENYLPLSNPTDLPHYPKKKNWVLVAAAGASVIVVALIVVLSFVLRGGLYPQFVVDDFNKNDEDIGYAAFDTKDVKMYIEETSAEGIIKRSWVIGGVLYEHDDNMGTECLRNQDDLLLAILQFFVQIVLPPEDAEKGGTMKVGDVECTIYHGKKIAVVEGHQMYAEAKWCVKDKFVHAITELDGVDDIFFKNHKKVSHKYKKFYPNTVCKTYKDDETLLERSPFGMKLAGLM